MASGPDPPNSASGRSRRPHFTTSLADFALPTRSASPSASSSSAAAPIQQRGLGSYALRPRSGLSRNIITAADDAEEDDEEGGDGNGRERSGGSGSGGPSSSASSSFLQPHRQQRTSPAQSFRSARDPDRLAASYPHSPPRSSMRGGERDSPFGARRGSMSGRQRASSPLSRGGKHMSPEPWSSAASTGVSGEVDDVELDLDGMDMRMGEADEEDQEELRDDEEDSTSSSPSKRNGDPSRQRQSFTPGPSSRSRNRSYEAGTPAPPLRRVLQLLKEEAKPGEGEVASEAKVTKRLGAINEAAAARSMREGSPFAMAARGTTPLRDADAIAGPQRGAGLGGGLLAGAAAAAAATAAGDDDLLDNVGFESSSSDALSSASEDGYIDDSDGTYEPASTPASLPPDVHSTGVTAPQDDIQMDDRDDEAMLDDSPGAQGGDAGLSMTPSANQQNSSAAVTSSGLFPISAISTPPPRFSTPSLPSSANVSPVNERGQAPAYAWEGRHLARGGTEAPRTPLSLSAMGVATGDAGRSLSISSPTSSSTAATPTQMSATGPLRGTGGVATGRKRTGSAWMDFRNSPNNAGANPAGSSAAGGGGTSGSLGGGGGGSSFDKRHHRLHGHHGRPYPHPHHHHKAKDMALAAAANRGLSTSPASTSAAYPGALAGFTAASASSRASSPTLAAAAVTSSASASAATKRKFGFGGSDSPGGSSSGGSSGGNGNGAGERSSDRFEPYMTSAYKRRAVSPLMSLGGFGGGAGGIMSSPVGHGGGGAESVGGTASSPARYPYHHSPAAWYHRNSVTSPTTGPVSSYFPPTSSGTGAGSSASSSNANAAAAAAVAGSSSSPLLSAVAPRTAAAREAAAQAAASAALGSLSDLHGLGMGGAEDNEDDELGGGRGATAAARAALPVRRREGTPTRVGTGNRASSGGSSSGGGGGMSGWGFPKSRMAQQTTATSTTPANSSSSPASAGIPPFGEDDAGLGPSVLAAGRAGRQE